MKGQFYFRVAVWVDLRSEPLFSIKFRKCTHNVQFFNYLKNLKTCGKKFIIYRMQGFALVRSSCSTHTFAPISVDRNVLAMRAHLYTILPAMRADLHTILLAMRAYLHTICTQPAFVRQ